MNPQLSSKLAKLVQGRLLGPSEVSFSRVVTDTRQLFAPEDCLFVALKGPRRNGHSYVQQAYDNGVRCFLIEEQVSVPDDAACILVSDTLLALQTVASHHRHRYGIPVIGITGSNGKTVVKEWLNILLAGHFAIARSPRSYNSQVGVPLSVLTLESGHNLGLFEAGISKPGEMDALRHVIHPSHVVLTNVLRAHRENFKDTSAIAAEKVKLAEGAHTVVYCADYPEWTKALSKLDERPAKLVSWSLKGEKARWQINEQQTGHFSFVSGKTRHELVLPAGDAASRENAIQCALVGLELGLEPELISRKARRFSSLPMRMELVEGKRRCTLLSDVYSSDPASLEIALQALDRAAEGKTKVAVLSDMEQTGLNVASWSKQTGKRLKAFGITRLIGVGPALLESEGVFTMPTRMFETVEDLMESDVFDALQNVAVLIKGGRKYRLERLVQKLSAQTHDTTLEVDLTAAQHNLHQFRSQLQPGVRLMAMVKASGYGAGAVELAHMLSFNRVNFLAVAYVDEGVALRESGISLPIMVMNPEIAAHDALIAHRLEPEIYSVRTLDALLAALERSNMEQPLPIHIKLDTGMARLGFAADEVVALGKRLATLPQLKVASVFSHLSAADDNNEQTWTDQQLSAFEHSAMELAEHLGYLPLRHILNTAGMLTQSPKYQFDMVRLGIGLYGISPVQGAIKLRAVNILQTVISQIKTVTEGASVGYGRSYRAEGNRRVATLPLGYADGLPRALSNGVGKVWINGKRAPIVGRVCMDMTMVDVTGIEAEEGDPVEIFGSNLPVEDLARWAGTIPYEILAAIPGRVRRLYTQA